MSILHHIRAHVKAKTTVVALVGAANSSGSTVEGGGDIVAAPLPHTFIRTPAAPTPVHNCATTRGGPSSP